MVGTTTSSSQSQSHSQSWIPDYEPQLAFLRQFGNDAAGLEQAQWNWALGQFSRDTGLTANNINSGYIPAAQNQFDAGLRDVENYDTMFAPELQRLDAERQYYNSSQGQAHERDTAEGTTAQNFTAQRKNLEADLGSYGINMADNPAKYAPQLSAIETREGAALAASANMALKAAQATGRGLTQEELANLGRLPGQSTMDTNVGYQALTGGQNAEFGNTSLGALTMGTPQDYLKSGISAVKYQPLGQTSESQAQSSEAGINTTGASAPITGLGGNPGSVGQTGTFSGSVAQPTTFSGGVTSAIPTNPDPVTASVAGPRQFGGAVM